MLYINMYVNVKKIKMICYLTIGKEFIHTFKKNLYYLLKKTDSKKLKNLLKM